MTVDKPLLNSDSSAESLLKGVSNRECIVIVALLAFETLVLSGVDFQEDIIRRNQKLRSMLYTIIKGKCFPEESLSFLPWALEKKFFLTKQAEASHLIDLH